MKKIGLLLAVIALTGAPTLVEANGGKNLSAAAFKALSTTRAGQRILGKIGLKPLEIRLAFKMTPAALSNLMHGKANARGVEATRIEAIIENVNAATATSDAVTEAQIEAAIARAGNFKVVEADAKKTDHIDTLVHSWSAHFSVVETSALGQKIRAYEQNANVRLVGEDLHACVTTWTGARNLQNLKRLISRITDATTREGGCNNGMNVLTRIKGSKAAAQNAMRAIMGKGAAKNCKLIHKQMACAA